MGQQQIAPRDQARLREFMRALLEDVRALERMIDEDRIESGIRRIGAEQEMFLVDSGMRPAPVMNEVMSRLSGGSYTTELGLFNLEANLTPYDLGPDCLTKMEAELVDLLDRARKASEEVGAKVLLVGILPTLELDDLGLESMTPSPRYHELNRIMTELRGGEFRTLIKGLDELHATHDNVMLEACNTSFQIHFQVGAGEFATLYNLAQAATAPVLAAAVNSPVLLQHRLWHETRVALFQQSLDARSKAHTARGTRQRVHFGDKWVKRSVLEIFREDIARYRVLIAGDLDESPMEVLDRGEVPQLRALRLHNGTIYRWNRPIYDVVRGRPHLRVENRLLPAGPSVVDICANAAFYYGLVRTLAEEERPLWSQMSFSAAEDNFHAGAREGIDTRLYWPGVGEVPVTELVLRRLLPAANAGLESAGIDAADRDRLLGVVERRCVNMQNGASWQAGAFHRFYEDQQLDRLEALRRMTVLYREHMHANEPVHDWPLP